MGFKYKVTLFTPTFNRAYVIEKLYRSIQKQTCRDFEWLIVDDGSSDNTQELVQGWIDEENDFPIRYYKTENGGKCRAINLGLDIAQGELFFTVDSDDELTENAVERVVYWESTIAEKKMYAGVMGNLGTSADYSPNRPLGAPFRDCSMLERYPEYAENVIDGERACVFYTEVHRKYKYPVYDGEKFMTESVTWNRMAHDGYTVRAFDEIIWIYEYLDDGLTNQGNMRFIANPRGAGIWLRERAEYIGMSFGKKMKMWYNFYCDHTSCEEKYRLNMRQCARYIGAPLPFVWCAAAVHGISGLLKSVR